MWWYLNDVALDAPLNLVMRVTATDTSPDQFTWKLAGDTVWQPPRDMTAYREQCLVTALTPGSTAPTEPCNSGQIPGSATLAAAVTYRVTSQRYAATSYTDGSVQSGYSVLTGAFPSPDDSSHRQVNRLRFEFTDSDLKTRRVAASAKDYYYFQFGSNGVNDAPECAGRGLCDYTSGVCRCFKGYAGMDCSEQRALSLGSSGGGGSGALPQ